MYGTYIPKQKFDLIRISVLRNTTKILKNQPYQRFILNNNFDNLLTK